MRASRTTVSQNFNLHSSTRDFARQVPPIADSRPEEPCRSAQSSRVHVLKARSSARRLFACARGPLFDQNHSKRASFRVHTCQKCAKRTPKDLSRCVFYPSSGSKSADAASSFASMSGTPSPQNRSLSSLGPVSDEYLQTSAADAKSPLRIRTSIVSMAAC